MNKEIFTSILKMLDNQPKKVILAGTEVGGMYLLHK